MSLRGDHRFSRRDANHPQVVGWYEELFCSVVDLSAVGGGVPDLLVGCAGRSELVEVKTEGGDLEPNQLTFAKTWRGNPVVVVRTQTEVIAHVQRIRQKVAGR